MTLEGRGGEGKVGNGIERMAARRTYSSTFVCKCSSFGFFTESLVASFCITSLAWRSSVMTAAFPDFAPAAF